MEWKRQPRSFWKERLTEMQYRVTRERGTERPFTGEYWNHNETGEYACVCCGTVLFDSSSKFHSACGWPSFNKAKDGNPSQLIDYVEDRSLSMIRTEIVCQTCGAHLGHVFDDGPPPTHKRYCLNSAALKFVPAGAVNEKSEK